MLRLEAEAEARLGQLKSTICARLWVRQVSRQVFLKFPLASIFHCRALNFNFHKRAHTSCPWSRIFCGLFVRMIDLIRNL